LCGRRNVGERPRESVTVKPLYKRISQILRKLYAFLPEPEVQEG
jgi:hypothetical protein